MARHVVLLLLPLMVSAREIYSDLQCAGNTDHGRTNVPADLGEFLVISHSSTYTCVVTVAEAVRCFGGVGWGTVATVPTDLAPADDVITGSARACAAKDKVILKCWGDTSRDGEDIVHPPGTQFDQYGMGEFHTCMLLNGTVSCLPTTHVIDSGVQQGRVVQLMVLHESNCVLHEDKTVVCWEVSTHGIESAPAGLGDVESLVGFGSGLCVCAYLTAGGVSCWDIGGRGSGSYLPSDATLNQNSPDQVLPGSWSMCIRTGGSIQCWAGISGWLAMMPTNWQLDPSSEKLTIGQAMLCRFKYFTTTSTATASTSTASTSTASSRTSTTQTSTTSLTSGTTTTSLTTSSTTVTESSTSSSSLTISSSTSSSATSSTTLSTSTTSSSTSSATSTSDTLTTSTSTTSMSSTSTTLSSTSTSSRSSSSTSTVSSSSSSTTSITTSSTSSSATSSTSSSASSTSSSSRTKTTSTSSSLTLTSSTSRSTSSSSTSVTSTSSTKTTSTSSRSSSTSGTGTTTTSSSSSHSSSTVTSSSSSTTTAVPALIMFKILGIDVGAPEENGTVSLLAAAEFEKAVEDAIFSMIASVSGSVVKREEMYTRLEKTTNGVVAMTVVPGLEAENAAVLNEKEEMNEAVFNNVKALPMLDSLLLPGAKLVVLQETTTMTRTTSSTTTTTLPSPEKAAGALLSAVGETSDILIAGLSKITETSIIMVLPDPPGTMAVKSLGDALTAAKDNNLRSVAIKVLGTGIDMDIVLPLSMFAALGVEEEVAMVVTAFEPSSANVKGLGKKADPVEGGEQVEVAGAVTIDLKGMTSRSLLNVEGLVEPITFTIPTNYTPGMVCAYWDEQALRWSEEGVWVSNFSDPGRDIECKTTHLSLFGAILRSIIQALMCMNLLNLLNKEAMQEILAGAWLTSMSATVLAVVFLMFGISFTIAAYLDHRRWNRHHWQDGFLLIHKPAPPVSSTDPAQQGGKVAAVMGGLCGCCAWLKGSDVVRQAVDDICSSWFEFFGEVRTAIETCIDCVGADLFAIGTGIFSGQASRLTHKAAAKMMMFVSRHKTAAHLGMSPDVVEFVLDDEDLADYLLEQRTHSGGVNWRMNQNQAQAWAGLREEISHHMVQNIMRQGHRRPLHYLKTVCMLALTENPIGALFVHDIFSSCKQRVLIFSSEVLGALAVSCLFFEQTGMAKGKPQRKGCDAGDEGIDIANSIGRFFVISFACLLVAGMPVHLITSLQTKSLKVMTEPPGSEAWEKQLRVWRFQERMVYVLAVLYNSLCTFYVISFVANIGNSDHSEWTTTGFLALFQDVLLLPFLTALIVPLIAQVILSLHLRLGRVHQERFTRQVCEMFHNNSNAMLPIERL